MILYQSALKDVTKSRLGILTEINQIARENIFSGLNNVDVNSVLAKNFEEYFSFTKNEVMKTLREYELEDEFTDVKHLCNSYNFNEKEIYNP